MSFQQYCFIFQDVPDFQSQFVSVSSLESKPLKGLRVGLIRETIDKGVDAGVISAIRAAAMHFEELGCSVNEVLYHFSLWMMTSIGSFEVCIIAVYISGCPFLLLRTYYRSHCHPFPWACLHIISLLCLNHLPTCLAMMVSGQWLKSPFLFLSPLNTFSLINL